MTWFRWNEIFFFLTCWWSFELHLQKFITCPCIFTDKALVFHSHLFYFTELYVFDSLKVILLKWHPLFPGTNELKQMDSSLTAMWVTTYWVYWTMFQYKDHLSRYLESHYKDEMVHLYIEITSSSLLISFSVPLRWSLPKQFSLIINSIYFYFVILSSHCLTVAYHTLWSQHG